MLVAEIDEAGGQETVAASRQVGAEDAVAFRRVDVTVEADCAASGGRAVARWGRLDVMVANAGIGALGVIANTGRAPNGTGDRGQSDRRLPLRQARLPGDAGRGRRPC